MALDKLEQQFRRAFAHPMFDELRALIPKEDQNDPKALAQWLTFAAEADPKGARRPGFHAAHAALHELNSAHDLQDRIGAIYWDPKLRAEVGEERIEAALRDPAGAYAELLERSVSGRLSPQLREAFKVLGEVRQFVTDNGGEWTSAPAPLPTDATGRETAIVELNKKAVSGRLSEAERDRLEALYRSRLSGGNAAEAEDARLAALAREGAATPAELASHAKALGMRSRPTGEFARLLEKSIGPGGLSADERSRMLEMSGQRAVEQGLATQEDLDAAEEQ